MTTVDTTIVRHDVIAHGGTAASYREYARFVANFDRRGVFSDIEVVVSWGGHEGRARIYGSFTSEALAQRCSASSNFVEMRMALFTADVEALSSLIRSATAANTESIGRGIEIADREAVRSDVADALGVDPFKQRVPVTREEAREWRSWFAAEDFFDLGDA